MKNVHDFQFYAQNFLKIVTKTGELQPLELNPYQTRLWHYFKRDIKEGKPMRYIVLKARQVGISTFGTGFVSHQTCTRHNIKATVIADDIDNTTNLFTMCKRYHDFLPADIKPMLRHSNQKKLVFENPDEKTRARKPGLMSSINLESANKGTAGRSGTTQILHCSEVAYWKNAGSVMSGLLQSVPYAPGTMILFESTANGVNGDGEEFYNRWCAAESGDSDFTPVFFPWHINREYEISPGPDFRLTEEEKDLMKRFPRLNERKLAWRRYKIKNEMGSALMDPNDQFRQEYPLTPDEAFIASGRNVFSIDQIREEMERVRSLSFKRGTINNSGYFEPSGVGKVRIYQNPNPGDIYVIGADVAEGIEGGDFSTAFVMNQRYEQVASYFGHIDPDLFGKDLCLLGEFYNNALLAPEVNNHGHSTMAAIRRYKYYNVYSRTVREERGEKYTKKIGWQTNRKTKMLMLDEFVASFRDRDIILRDLDLLKEMMTVNVDANGDVILNGKDRIVSACIALQAIKQANINKMKAIVPQSMTQPKGKSFKERLKEYDKSAKRDVESYFD